MLASKMRLGFIQGFDRDQGHALLERVALGIALGLAPHKKRNFLKFAFGIPRPLGQRIAERASRRLRLGGLWLKGLGGLGRCCCQLRLGCFWLV